MTAPRFVYDPTQYEIGSASYNQQLTQFNAQRDAYLQKLLALIGGPPPQATAPMVQQEPPASRNWRDDELLGAARWWGMPDEVAATMPRSQLAEYINDMRSKARPVDRASFEHVKQATIGMAGIGALQGVTQGLRNLPLVGEALGRIGILHEANIYLKSLEEGVRASIPERTQLGLSGAKLAGNIAAMWYPALAAWKVASVAGGVGGAISGGSPIVRGAFQGVGTAWLLEAGGPEYEDNKALILGVGAGLGAAAPTALALWRRFRPATQAAAEKVIGDFMPPPQSLESATAPATPQAGTATPAPSEGLRTGAERFTRQPVPGTIPLTEAPLPRGFESDAAGAHAAALNKAGAVLNSPNLPEMIARPKINDLTVAEALHRTNPGSTGIVQGVADPLGFLDSPWEHVRFVKGPYANRLDAIVSDKPITAEMVKDYETLGVYLGQQVTTRGGMTGTIEVLKGGRATIRLANTSSKVTTDIANLSPSIQSPGVTEASGLWEEFQRFSMGKAMEAGAQLAPGDRIVPAQIETLLKQNLPQYLEDFLNRLGVTKSEAARIRAYFNVRHVEGFKDLAPGAVMESEAAVARAVDVADSSGGMSPLGVLDEHAATRGFVVTPEPGAGVSLIDTAVGAEMTAPTEMKFASKEAAHDWLRNLNRDLPDVTPPLDVPGEIAGMQHTAPPQAPNLNPRIETGIAAEIEGLAAAPENAELGAIAAQAKALVATGRMGKLQSLYISAVMNLSSMRKLIANVDQFAFEGGLYERGLTPFKDYQAISTSLNAHQNMMEPMQEAAQQVMQDIRVANRRSGLWSQIYLIEDAAERTAAATKAGLNPAEIGAFDKMSKVWHDFFGQTGLSPEREIRQYLPLLQKMQSTGDFAGMTGWRVSPESEAFMLFVRNGLVNARELDPEVLLATYIRTLSWNKNVEQPFAEVAKKWNLIKREIPELAPASDIVQNWLHVVKYGYQPGADALLDWAHIAARGLIGPGVSRQMARQLVNFGLNNSYSALMGYRVDLAARDLQQIWLAYPRAGGKLLQVMGRFMTGSKETKAAMWEQAITDRMVSLQHPRALAPGATMPLEAAAFDPTGLPPELAAELMRQTAAGVPSAREQALGRISAAVEDMAPNWMKSTKLRPGYIYGKQGEIVRMLVGAAGKETAAEAIAVYRAAGPGGDLARLLNESKANTFFPAVAREFERLIASGADEEAAAFLGRQLADTSQFKYGLAEAPVYYRTVTGRMWSQLGSYPLYYAQYLAEVARYGTTASKVATVATIGTVSAAFYAASKVTGWNFYRMNPFTGINFVMGGPLLEQVQDVAQAATGFVSGVTGQNLTQVATPDPLAAMGRATNLVNPFTGVIRTLGGVGLALDSPNTPAALTRLAVTGERGAGPDINAMMLPQAQAAFQRSLQSQPTPMRQGAFGTQQIPQQQVTMPPEIMTGSPLGASNPMEQQRQLYDGAARQLRERGAPESTIVSILGPRP